jgi:1-acyl-sn-glycerol-3-phosphate acyltransferase
MPSGKESQLRPGQVKIVVHKALPAKGRDADELCDEARAAVASALPPELVGSSTMMLADE